MARGRAGGPPPAAARQPRPGLDGLGRRSRARSTGSILGHAFVTPAALRLSQTVTGAGGHFITPGRAPIRSRQRPPQSPQGGWLGVGADFEGGWRGVGAGVGSPCSAGHELARLARTSFAYTPPPPGCVSPRGGCGE